MGKSSWYKDLGAPAPARSVRDSSDTTVEGRYDASDWPYRMVLCLACAAAAVAASAARCGSQASYLGGGVRMVHTHMGGGG